MLLNFDVRTGEKSYTKDVDDVLFLDSDIGEDIATSDAVIIDTLDDYSARSSPRVIQRLIDEVKRLATGSGE